MASQRRKTGSHNVNWKKETHAQVSESLVTQVYNSLNLTIVNLIKSESIHTFKKEAAMKLFYASCFAAIALVACEDKTTVSATDGDGTPVKIGFLVSGDRTTYPNGAKIAVDEVNERGGLLGRPVELVIQMNIQEAAAAVQAAETMILTDEVVALVGPNRSSHAIEVGAVAQRHGVPMITTAATNPAVTAAGEFVFMAAFTDQFQGRVMAQFAKETLGVNTAAVLTHAGKFIRRGLPSFLPPILAALEGRSSPKSSTRAVRRISSRN